jgi:hypothetical protein
MTTLTDDNIRRLDALNLIESIANHDKDTAASIMAMYAERTAFDDPNAFHDLAWGLAFAAAALFLQHIPDRDDVLADARRRLLSDEAQEEDR